jgi:hypothetical protein
MRMRHMYIVLRMIVVHRMLGRTLVHFMVFHIVSTSIQKKSGVHHLV